MSVHSEALKYENMCIPYALPVSTRRFLNNSNWILLSNRVLWRDSKHLPILSSTLQKLPQGPVAAPGLLNIIHQEFLGSTG